MNKQFIIAAAMAAGVAAQAAPVYISGDISTSTTLPALPAGDYYCLTNQVFVLPGASLTIEAGALFKNDLGSLAVSRGAQIFVQGTKDEPVIMTSVNDDLATWRPSANEWGNLTIMGNGMIGAASFDGITRTNSAGFANSSQPDGRSDTTMEGLTAAFPGDTRHYYGGNNDCDDSGSIKYLSIRYGGKVIGLGNELNGLSLGGIGESTDIDYVEIMNNVDDGIEIWGGKVHLKHVNIWNIGDDSFDIDQGWRGRAQFGLIVQGYSLDAKQGSGVGDNCFEHDGAEDSDAQPVTTAEIYNFTVVGQPAIGDGGTAWRDNARVQYHNCIWMDLGEKLVRFDGDDGDGQSGYGHNGTLSWADTWTTPYNVLPANSVGVSPYSLYTAQSSGYLAQITDSIFYRNLHADAYSEANARGVTNAANNNIVEPADMPIAAITRGTPVVTTAGTVVPVISIDPCAANDAVSSGNTAPENGFYDQASFIGGFSADNNWLLGWSAADQFGLLDASSHVGPSINSIVTGGVGLSFDTQDGVWYTVQSSTDAGFTSPVDEADVLGDGLEKSWVDAAADPAKFFRVVLK